MKSLLVVVGSFLAIFIIIVLITSIVEITNYQCPFEHFMHIYCAGCGTTRMFQSIFKLNFYQAFRYNPLIFIYTWLLTFYTIVNGIRYIKGDKLIKISLKVIVVFVLILLIYMFLRNIPVFSYLKPTTV